MHELRGMGGQQVAQVIEARLLGGDVGDVGGVGAAALLARAAALDPAGAQAEESVDGPHPFGVAPGQVVVEREHVDAVPGQRVQRGGHDRGQRLALAGRHLHDVAVVQRQRRHHLLVVGPLSQRAPRRLADDGEGRDHVMAGVERAPAHLQRRIVERLQRGLERADGTQRRVMVAQVEVDGGAPQPCQAPAHALPPRRRHTWGVWGAKPRSGGEPPVRRADLLRRA